MYPPPSEIFVKSFLLALTTVLLTTLAGHSSANQNLCGTGTIAQIKEGGWDKNDLLIKIQTSETVSGLWFDQYVRYVASELGAERMESIRRAAYTAFALEAVVQARSKSSNCSHASELTIYR